MKENDKAEILRFAHALRDETLKTLNRSTLTWYRMQDDFKMLEVFDYNMEYRNVLECSYLPESFKPLWHFGHECFDNNGANSFANDLISKYE